MGSIEQILDQLISEIIHEDKQGLDRQMTLINSELLTFSHVSGRSRSDARHVHSPLRRAAKVKTSQS